MEDNHYGFLLMMWLLVAPLVAGLYEMITNRSRRASIGSPNSLR